MLGTIALNPFFYLAPAVIVSATGLILCGLGIRRHQVVSTWAAVSAASPWLFFAIIHGRLRTPFGPQWLVGVIFLFSIFGPGILFGGVMAGLALSKDQDKGRKTSLLWVAAVGLIVSTLHTVACWHLLKAMP